MAPAAMSGQWSPSTSPSPATEWPKASPKSDGSLTGYGGGLEIKERGHTYTDMVVNPLLADLYADNSEALGRPMDRANDLEMLKTGSTDMANVSHVLPSLHPMLNIHCDPHVNHQREFAAATVDPPGHQAMRDGALGMAWTVVDIARGDRWSELEA